MKRLYLGILVFSLLCLILAAYVGIFSNMASRLTHQATKPALPAVTGMQTVKVTIGDFYIHSAVTTFTTGKVYKFLITNVGTHYHNFLLMHPVNTFITLEDVYNQALTFQFDIAPNETRSINFLFEHTAPPGMLEFSCHYGGHYEAGMHQAIVVNAAPGTSVSPYSNDDLSSSTAPQTNSPCDPAVTIQNDNNAYTPSRILLKVGEALTITNTDSQYTPTFSPEAGTTPLLGGPKNTTSLIFNYPGMFTLSSQEHPEAQAIIWVSQIAGSTCGMSPVTTVYFNTSYIPPKSGPFFTPTQVTIKKGQSIKLSNLIDQKLTFVSTPDAGLGNIQTDRCWSEDLLFTTAGTYTISSVQMPNKKFTVTVQG